MADGTLLALGVTALGAALVSRQGSRAMVRRAGGALESSRVSVVGTFGDVNPIEHGGGVVLMRSKSLGDPKGVSPWIEHVYALSDDEEEDDPSIQRLLYQVSVPLDVAEEFSWADWDVLATYQDTTERDLRERARSRGVRLRASIVELVADHYGWNTLDEYPTKVTNAELKERWGLDD